MATDDFYYSTFKFTFWACHTLGNFQLKYLFMKKAHTHTHTATPDTFRDRKQKTPPNAGRFICIPTIYLFLSYMRRDLLCFYLALATKQKIPWGGAGGNLTCCDLSAGAMSVWVPSDRSGLKTCHLALRGTQFPFQPPTTILHRFFLESTLNWERAALTSQPCGEGGGISHWLGPYSGFPRDS